MNQENINKFLYSLYDDVSPMSVSIACRKKHNLYEDRSLVYGDSHLPSLYEIFNRINPKPEDVFYDLGSGGGRVVLFAALSLPFAKCVGVELLDDLYNLANNKLEQCKKMLPTLADFDPTKLGEITFLHQDFLTVDISEANVVYITATCMEEQLMSSLTELLEKQLLPNARVITLTKSLNSKKFNLLKVEPAAMEWGQVTVFYHQKI